MSYRSVLARSAAMVACLLIASAPLYAQGASEYIVQFQPGLAPAARGAAVAAAGGAVNRLFVGVSAAAVRVPNDQALAALRQNPAVLSVVPNRRVVAYQSANAKGGKPGGSTGAQVTSAGVTRVGVPTAASNGAGVGVAVLDTGVDLAHPDLTGTSDAFSAFGGSCQDDQGHGTHVAGIIGARDNAIDVIGVAPSATIYCVKVLDGSGSGTDEDVMAGLDWVVSHHAAQSPAIQVINMSLGREGSADDNPAMRDLVAALEAAGVLVVVAAGNDPSLDVSQQVPSAYATVAPAASTTALAGSNACRFLASPIAADTASYFTSDGIGVTVSAPGEERENVSRGCMIQSVGILSTKLGGGTTRLSGTSMAAPHVAGIAARHYQINPAFLPAQVRGFIAADADRQGTAPLDSPTGGYTFDGVREGVAQAP